MHDILTLQAGLGSIEDMVRLHCHDYDFYSIISIVQTLTTVVEFDQ